MVKNIFDEPILKELPKIVELQAQKFVKKRKSERLPVMPGGIDTVTAKGVAKLWGAIFNVYDPTSLAVRTEDHSADMVGEEGPSITFSGSLLAGGEEQSFQESVYLGDLQGLRRDDPLYLLALEKFLWEKELTIPPGLIRTLIFQPPDDLEVYEGILFSYYNTSLKTGGESLEDVYLDYDQVSRGLPEAKSYSQESVLRCIFALGLAPKIAETGIFHAAEGLVLEKIQTSRVGLFEENQDPSAQQVWASMDSTTQNDIQLEVGRRSTFLGFLKALGFVGSELKEDSLGKVLRQLVRLEKDRIKGQSEAGVRMKAAVSLGSYVDPPPSTFLKPYDVHFHSS
jgi:hypothetical protein